MKSAFIVATASVAPANDDHQIGVNAIRSSSVSDEQIYEETQRHTATVLKQSKAKQFALLRYDAGNYAGHRCRLEAAYCPGLIEICFQILMATQRRLLTAASAAAVALCSSGTTVAVAASEERLCVIVPPMMCACAHACRCRCRVCLCVRLCVLTRSVVSDTSAPM